MVINMTELPLARWSSEQLEAARKLCYKNNVISDGSLPIILPTDKTFRVLDLAWTTEKNLLSKDKIDAVIIQGEPCFVYYFVAACKDEAIPCYSPCYEDSKFVQFRRF